MTANEESGGDAYDRAIDGAQDSEHGATRGEMGIPESVCTQAGQTSIKATIWLIGAGAIFVAVYYFWSALGWLETWLFET